MDSLFIYVGVGLLILMFMTMYRVVSGPTAIDRVMGLNVIGTKTTILLIIIGTIFHRVEMFVDIALAYALLNFIATLAAARYIYAKHEIFSDDKDSSEDISKTDEAAGD